MCLVGKIVTLLLVRHCTGQQLEEFHMKVILEPVSATAKENLERAKLEIERVLAFRGSVTSVKAKGTRIVGEFEINPKWDLPMSERNTNKSRKRIAVDLSLNAYVEEELNGA